MKGMVLGTLRIPLSADRRAEVLEVLRSIQGPVLAQPGCAGCNIYEDQGPEPAAVLVERWESQAALEEHIRSESYRRILGAIELSSSPPSVRFDHVSASEGMELIERLRNLGGTRWALSRDSPEGTAVRQPPQPIRRRPK